MKHRPAKEGRRLLANKDFNDYKAALDDLKNYMNKF